jgi:hypothetical protein
MPPVEPTEAINLVEQLLRDLVRIVLGDNWKTQRVINLADLERKRTEDVSKRRGSIVSDDLLAYTEFYQLKAIILDNWNAFAPALGKQKYISVYLDRLEGFRNPAMHSRTLLPFERHLVEGIVGELRNLMTIYRSTKGPDMEYYPRIELVRDSFGRTWTEKDSSPTQQPIRLQVGQVVEFECHGEDPQGRELTWRLTRNFMDTVLASAAGADAVLIWTVDESDVRESYIALITLHSSGRYHRHDSFDELAAFNFQVSPPD